MSDRKTNSIRYDVLHRFAVVVDEPIAAPVYFQRVKADISRAVPDANAMSRMLADAFRNGMLSRTDLPDDGSRGPLDARFGYFMTPEQKAAYAAESTFDYDSYVPRAHVRRTAAERKKESLHLKAPEEVGASADVSHDMVPAERVQLGGIAEDTAQRPLDDAFRMEPVLQVMTSAFEMLISRSLRQAVQGPMVQDAIREAMSRIAQGMVGAVSEQPVQHPEETVQKPKEADTRPQILIAGLQPKQRRELEETFKGKLKLRFWKAEHGKNLSADVVRNSDLVVASRFVDHPSTYIMQADRSKFRLVSGGVTNIKRELTRFLEGWPSHNAAA